MFYSRPPTRIVINLKTRLAKRDFPAQLVDDIGYEEQTQIEEFGRSKLWNSLPSSWGPDDLKASWKRTAYDVAYSSDEKWALLTAPRRAPPSLMGFIVFMTSESILNPPANLLHIKLIAVHPLYRSWGTGSWRVRGRVRGVAMALLWLARERARTLTGNEVLGLHVNGRAEQLYRRLGMRHVPQGDQNGYKYYEGKIRLPAT